MSHIRMTHSTPWCCEALHTRIALCKTTPRTTSHLHNNIHSTQYRTQIALRKTTPRTPHNTTHPTQYHTPHTTPHTPHNTTPSTHYHTQPQISHITTHSTHNHTRIALCKTTAHPPHTTTQYHTLHTTPHPPHNITHYTHNHTLHTIPHPPHNTTHCTHSHTLNTDCVDCVVQPNACLVSFNPILQSLSNTSLFNGTWLKRPIEPDNRLIFEIRDMTLQTQYESCLAKSHLCAMGWLRLVASLKL